MSLQFMQRWVVTMNRWPYCSGALSTGPLLPIGDKRLLVLVLSQRLVAGERRPNAFNSRRRLYRDVQGFFAVLRRSQMWIGLQQGLHVHDSTPAARCD